jgi:AcrR family transcriptional regulator
MTMTVDPVRGLRADARRNVERLVEVAAQVFAEQGPEAPLTEIARAAGVGTATLYRRFPTREDLLAAVYAGHVSALADRAEELAVAPVAPVAALVSWLNEFAGLLSEQRGMKGLLAGRYEDSGTLFASCRRRLQLAAEALLRPAQATGLIRADVTAERSLILVHAVVIAASRAGEDCGEVKHLIELLIHGFRPAD